jgi:hypothetical protein
LIYKAFEEGAELIYSYMVDCIFSISMSDKAVDLVDLVAKCRAEEESEYLIA